VIEDNASHRISGGKLLLLGALLSWLLTYAWNREQQSCADSLRAHGISYQTPSIQGLDAFTALLPFIVSVCFAVLSPDWAEIRRHRTLAIGLGALWAGWTLLWLIIAGVSNPCFLGG
jgi:uncharacterized protein YjeT (DUF2065 family)